MRFRFFKLIRYFTISSSLIVISGCNQKYTSPLNNKKYESVKTLINLSKENKYKNYEKIKLLDSSYKFLSQIHEIDSTKLKYLIKVAFRYSKLNDSLKFFKINKEARNMAFNLKDTNRVAETYWDMATYNYHNSMKEKAYFYYNLAQKNYYLAGNNYYSAKMLLNMAIMQSDVRDYTGSEITTVKALKIFKTQKRYKELYKCYNNLGVVFNNLKEYDKSILYHRAALGIIKHSDNEILEAATLNNIGIVYENQNNYLEAIRNYEQAFSFNTILKKAPDLYAMLIDNRAYAKLHMENSDKKFIFEELEKALSIRDSLNLLAGIVTSNIHLSEYYLSSKDTLKSLQLAYNAYKKSKNTVDYGEHLEALLLLAKIDKVRGGEYLQQYISINDRLLLQERTTRNKYARIRYETNEFKEENKELNQRIIIITGIIIALIFIVVLIFILRRERERNKELFFNQQLQQSNEEIYDLLMNQQNKVYEARKLEQQRISLELHDGVLGRLFGIRLNLENLNFNINNSNEQNYIKQLQSVEKEIRDISHELSTESKYNNVDYFELISELCKSQCAIKNIDYDIINDTEIDWDHISGTIKMNVYRIFQEALQNTIKHSNATNVKILINKDEYELDITIMDNGQGTVTYGKEKKGIGMKNIKTRVEKMFGKLYIKFSEELGTEIHFIIPI